MSAIAQRVNGPYPIRLDDLPALNAPFSDAFSERYRRDGMVGVRVPPLNPSIWRFAIDGAAEGAMVWRDGLGRLAAFNLAHVSGTEGWMGPLAVREDLQGRGVGTAIVQAGIARLKSAGCRVIGLETMPRTMDNIGFYAGLGFVPARMTITLTLEGREGSPVDPPPPLLGHTGLMARDAIIAECAALTAAVHPGADYSREMRLTLQYALGDTLLLRDDTGQLRGFALCHDAPLVEGRAREELRVLKLVVDDDALLPRLADALTIWARRVGALRVAVRVQGEYGAAFRALIARGARVRWTDLRMTLAGFEDRPAVRGVALSNWEI